MLNWVQELGSQPPMSLPLFACGRGKRHNLVRANCATPFSTLSHSGDPIVEATGKFSEWSRCDLVSGIAPSKNGAVVFVGHWMGILSLYLNSGEQGGYLKNSWQSGQKNGYRWWASRLVLALRTSISRSKQS